MNLVFVMNYFCFRSTDKLFCFVSLTIFILKIR